MSEPRKILMTCGLPYANGYIHIGHLVEYIQADFWSRFQKMQGHDCLFFCGADTHGTPIMVKARELKITPEELIAKSREEHMKDFSDFLIEFEHYGSTHSPENQKLSEFFYQKFVDGGHITSKKIQQYFCDHDKMFLPDRFVKGTCPKCNAIEQYGDSCDVCGATYAPSDLKAVHCSLCGNAPHLKDSESLFFKLNDFKAYLEEWIPKHTTSEVAKKMMEWFSEDLHDLDISRSAPYFGFPIPGTNNEKFFYVWVDAPMGYISTTEQWAKANSRTLKDIWHDPKREVYHFIGKDIARFHTIFWPAFLKAADIRGPNEVFVHGHLMVNGEKMSKSKGTFIAARTYLNHLDPEYLRYYYGAKLNGSPEDMDLNLQDFSAKVNSELIGKITNLGSRGAQMLTKKMDSCLSIADTEGLALIKEAQNRSAMITKYFEARDFSKGLTEIREIADLANKYFDEKAPWKTLATNPEETKKVLTSTLNVFRILAIYLKPILPNYAKKVEALFNEKPYTWADSQNILPAGHRMSEFTHLAVRIEDDKIKAVVEESQKLNASAKEARARGSAGDKTKGGKPMTSTHDNLSATSQLTGNSSTENSDGSGLIEFTDFEKVVLKIGLVVEAEEIKEADKLLRLQVDIGEDKPRQIIAGIKSAYSAESLKGRKLLVCTNLKPRKMKFGISEGMVLAASSTNGKPGLFVLSPDDGAEVGYRVK